MDALFGGIYPRVVHMAYGPTAVGKTTIAAYVPMAQIFKSLKGPSGRKNVPDRKKFFVIDGDGGFDFERAAQVFRGAGLDPDEVFEHLEYFQPTSFDEQHKTITQELEAKCKQGVDPILITADPLVAIYRGIILRTSLQYRMASIGGYTGKLDLQLAVIRKLAVKYNCPAWVTSWPGSNVGESMGAAKAETPVIGGRSFGFLPKVMIELRKPADHPTLRECYLYKHRSMPSGRSCYYNICDTGIEDVTPELLKEAGLEV